MATPSNRQASIDSRRIALEREIAIRLPAFDQFVTEYSTNLSTTGMFVQSDNPQPPGTHFIFEFSVADDWKLIRGKGEVVWARYSAEADSRPAGMGIRFTELDAQSRRLIRWIVEKHIREGGKPFDLEELRSEVDQALVDVLDEEPQPERAAAPLAPVNRPVEAAPEERRPWGLMAILGSGAAVLAILAAILWMSEPAPSPEPVAAAPAAAPQPAPAPSATTVRTRPEPGPDLAAVPSAVTSWSRAWSSQRPDLYLGHYADGFVPPNGLSRAAWEAIRRERLTTPASIALGITALETESIAEDRAAATFTQTYRSDVLEDVVRKRLELVWEEGTWKIRQEEVLAILG